MTGRLKKLPLLAALLTGLALLGAGCDSLKPSASVPEWEQSRSDYRSRTDTKALEAEDAFWQMPPFWQLVAVLSEYLSDAN